MWADRLRNLRLESRAVTLRPLARSDRDALAAIAFDPEIWRYFVFRVDGEKDLDRFVDDAVNDTAEGKRAVFAIVDHKSGAIAGSMAFGNLAERDQRIEIGWSWLGAPFRGTQINAWTKYLLLEHAFAALGCERVEFKTDVLNVRARAGLKKIGAVEEGVLRSYNVMPGGRRRDAVYYSILKGEWQAAKATLLRLLADPDGR